MNADAFKELVKKQKETQKKLWEKVKVAEISVPKALAQADIAF